MNQKDLLLENTIKKLQEDNKIEQTVELGNARGKVYSQDELDCFNAIKNTISGLEQFVTNFNITLFPLEKANVTFKTSDGSEFEVTFDTESFGKVTEVQTTFSNQEVTKEFIELATLLLELKN